MWQLNHGQGPAQTYACAHPGTATSTAQRVPSSTATSPTPSPVAGSNDPSQALLGKQGLKRTSLLICSRSTSCSTSGSGSSTSCSRLAFTGLAAAVIAALPTGASLCHLRLPPRLPTPLQLLLLAFRVRGAALVYNGVAVLLLLQLALLLELLACLLEVRRQRSGGGGRVAVGGGGTGRGAFACAHTSWNVCVIMYEHSGACKCLYV